MPAIIAGITALLWLTSLGQSPDIHPFYLFSFIFSISTACLIGAVGAARAGKYRLIPKAVFMPAYWALLFAPSLRAIWELRRIPFHWHKTEHGVSPAPKSNMPHLADIETESARNDPIK